MAERVRYVRTSADAGGDGTTNTDSSGDNTHAYVGLAEAEAGEQADLVTAGDTLRIVCSVGSGSAADSGRVTFSDADWTTGASNGITIEAASGEEATAEWDATKYRLTDAQGFSSVLTSDDVFMVVRNLQINNTDTSNQPRGIQIDGSSAINVDIDNCYIKAATTGLSSVSAGLRHNNSNASSLTRAWNTVIEGHFDGVNNAFSHSEIILYNLTVVSVVGNGINLAAIGGSGTLRAKNLILEAGSGSAWVTASPGTTDYVDVFVDDTSSPSSDNSKTFTFASATDFTNASDSNAVDAGTSLAADANLAFSDDINGVTRSTWDVGAGEYVAVGGATVRKLIDGGLVNNGLINSGLIHRIIKRLNGVWRPDTRLLVPVGIQLQGAR